MKPMFFPRAAFPNNPFDGVVKRSTTPAKDPFLNADRQEGRMPNLAFADAPPTPRAIPMMSDAEAKQQAIDKASRGPMTGPAFGAKGTPVDKRGNVESFDLTRDLSQGFGSGGYGAQASARDGAVRTGSLRDRGAVPVGRSGRDPQRRFEIFQRRAWTRGDEAAGMHMAGQLQQQQSHQNFAREMNGVNFQQGLFMNDQQQRGMDARQQQDRQDRFDMWNADQGAQAARDAQQFQNQLTMFGLNQGADAMAAERKRQEEEAARNRVPNFGQVPIQGTGYAGTYADGHPMGNVPMNKPDAPVPGGMVPESYTDSKGVRYGQPQAVKPEKKEKPNIQWQNGVPYHITTDDKGNPQVRKLSIIDENHDGIDDRQQMGGGGQGDLSKRPAQTTGTSKYASDITRLMGGK